MITLYVYDISNWIKNVTMAQRQRMLSLVCVDRQNKIQKMKITKGQDCVLIAGYLLEQRLRDYIRERYEEAVHEFHFLYGEQGKPYLPDYPEVHFNLSHSGSYVAIAVGHVTLGVDVEVNSRNALAVARRCFHEKEYEELLRYKNEPERLDQRFKQYWSMKEAYIKYRGEGLKIPLSSFGVLPEENRIAGQERLALYWKNLDGGCVCLCYEAEGAEEVNYCMQMLN